MDQQQSDKEKEELLLTKDQTKPLEVSPPQFLCEQNVRDMGLWKKLFFSWANPLIAFSKKNVLHINQMGDIRQNQKVEVQYLKLKKSWKKYKHSQGNALFKAVIHAYRYEYLIAVFFNLLITAAEISTPFLVKRIIEFIQSTDDDVGYGFGLVSILVVTQGLQYIINDHIDYYQRLIGVRSTNALISMIYKKILKVSSATNKKFSNGEIVNFIQVDAQKLNIISENLATVLKLPIILVTCIILLFYFIGVAFFAGVAVLIVAFVMNLLVSRYAAKIQTSYMKYQDQRVNLTTECLNNIKMLKLYSWQEPFEKMISEKRQLELDTLWRRFRFGMVNTTSLYFFPSILGSVVFSTYIGMGNTLELSVAYTITTIFNLIKQPLLWLPIFIGLVIEFTVSMKRIQDFLLCPEINKSVAKKIDFEEDDKYSITIKNGNFHWGLMNEKDKKEQIKHKNKGNKQVKSKVNLEEAKPLMIEEEKRNVSQVLAIRNINLEFKHGEFICIIGDVGSGKSSLLSSIIGDLLYLDPSFLNQYRDAQLNEELIEKIKQESAKFIDPRDTPIILSEDVAYVQQNPWIQNKTIRDNILFGLPFDQDRYEETIDICELARDLEILPSADMTEIGEKGINLSGGQKARVSLARAVYSDKAIMLMDDPISALDANVKKKIFQNVFMDKFRNKTRLLVTHAIDFLHLVDKIIVLSKGEVILQGSYDEIKENPYLIEIIGIHKGHQEDATNMVDSGKDKSIEKSQNIQISDKSDDDSLSQNDSSSNLSSSDNEISDGEESNKNKNDTRKGRRVNSKANRSFSMTSLSSANQGKMIQDENIEETKVGFDVPLRYLKYFGGWKVFITLMFIFVGFTSVKILSDYQVGNWATAKDQQENFSFYCGLSFLYAFLQSLFVFFRVYLMQYFSWFATKNLHQDMIKSVLNAPINLYFDVTPIGRILNKFSKDLSTLELQLAWQVGSFFVLFFQALAIIIQSIIVVYWIVILIIFLGILAVKLYSHSIGSYRETTRIESLTRSPLLSFMSESCSGASTIRAFGKQKQFIVENNKLLNKNILAVTWQAGTAQWFALRLDLLSIVILAFATFFCIINRHSVDSVFLAMLLSNILLLQDFVLYTLKIYAMLEARMVNVDRCLKVLEIPQEQNKPADDRLNFFDARPDWPESGRVEFESVYLKYRPTTETILKDLSFEVKPGEKIGIVGRTGAGKSTICLSLHRIMEISSGYIMIDGVDIKELELHELRKRITVIPQDPTMFTGTLRFNLDPENRTPDDRIIELLKEANLEDMINKDPKGIYQDIAENGSNLSSGEKQLLCICRAILRRSKIVILDEATANIDVVTEQKIQRLIQLEFKESTMITIAHRLNTIIQSDRVLVLSFGQIKEYDTPKNLMQNPDSEFTKLLKQIQKEEGKTDIPLEELESITEQKTVQ
eukprot:403340529